MARNKRKSRPLGLGIGELWGDALSIDPGTMAGRAVEYVYRNGGVGGEELIVRAMVKFEEIEATDQSRHERAVARIRRAQAYGCKVIICLDWHNSADRRADYHKYQYFPTKKSIAEHVRDVIVQFRPWAIQVANEYWHLKGSKDMRAKAYKARVFEYAHGCRIAEHEIGWKGLLIASNVMEKPRDKVGDLWMWDVDWDNCAEGIHDLIMSDGPSTPAGLQQYLSELRYAKDKKAVGWVWPLIRDECSAVNNTVDINTDTGAGMMQVLLEHHRKLNFPLCMLTMDGRGEGGGEWGMRTWFVNQDGDISKGAKQMLRFVGSDPDPDLGNGEPPPPPPDRIDMLELMAPKGVDFAKTSARGGRMSTIRDDENRIFVLSKYDGATWDWFWYDDDFIYHFLTEDGDKDDTTAFKTHAAPGVIWCRRFATLGESHVSSPYIYPWRNCTQGSAHPLHSANTRLHDTAYTAAQLSMESDDVPGSTICYRIDWRWGPTINELETFTYATGWGWLDWDADGHDVKPFNMRSPKPIIQPQFPCFDVADWVDENMRPDDPPPPPPNGGGWYSIHADSYLKFTNATAAAALATINGGSNHFEVSQVALGPTELAAVQRELTKIVGG